MISIQLAFYMLVIFFALIGSLRGWQREVLACTGLIGAIAALNQFGYAFVSTFVNATPMLWGTDPNAAEQAMITVQAIFLCTIAFFAYQVVARLADVATGGRLGDKVRHGFQKRFMGSLLGALNGYLLVGGLWSFLEYVMVPTGGYELRPLGQPYPFDPTVLMRPVVTDTSFMMTDYLPLGLIGPNMWLLCFFIAFFVVIIALI